MTKPYQVCYNNSVIKGEGGKITEQLVLFDSNEYLDTTIELKIMIKKIIDCYENEESWMYCDTEAMLDLIKMLIIF